MKFPVIVSLFAVLFAACAADKELIDKTTVNDDCPSGCNSNLKVTLKSKGTGGSEWRARVDCYLMARLTTDEIDGVCRPLCGLSKARESFTTPGQLCSLCDGNGGAGLIDCRQKLAGLVSKVQQQCFTSDPVPAGVGFEVYSTATVTNFYAGVGCN